MDDTNVSLPLLPAHIEETIRSIARLHAEHHQNATPLQRAVDRITALLGRPRFMGILTVIAAGWISLNLLATALGYRAIDPPPFSELGGAVSLASLYLVVLILATQRREYQLAQLREQLTLELAILSEQKTAKVIQLRSFATGSIRKQRLWLRLPIAGLHARCDVDTHAAGWPRSRRLCRATPARPRLPVLGREADR